MELELVYNEETKEWEQKKEPFVTIEVETEEDFEFIGNAIAFYKKHLSEQEKPQTNADRIRAMSDEELAKILNAFTTYFEECNRSIEEIDCHDCELCELCSLGEGKAIDWLKQPVKENDNG